jgi:hypothetical protein
MGESYVESWSGKTHTGSQDGRILSVVGNDDEPAEDSHRVHKERQTDERPGHLCKHLFAQLASATTFDTVQVRVNSTGPFPLCHCAQGCNFGLTHPRHRWSHRVPNTA